MASPSMGTGKLLGHYRIVERVGEGGMGVVYRAHDERLRRDVALKIIPPCPFDDSDSRKRFHKEARVLARLNHPNIATVYDFDSQDGTDFLVTEYVPGETLADRLASLALPQKEVLRLGMQLADGLAAAHQAGVLHRDIKPANLQLTPDGRLKILDFGLAQFSQTVSSATTESVLDLPLAGTLPYQSPEQLRGEPASVRTDIYSAGAVLYEMATGRRAFGDAPAFQVIHRILHELPARPCEIRSKLSPQLENAILKCLDKDPENRYHSATELGVDLRRLALPSPGYIPVSPRQTVRQRRFAIAAASVAVILLLAIGIVWAKKFLVLPNSRIRSLAVLPLRDFSGAANQEYFADGITEELITDLAQISALRVISRTSAMTYKGSTKSLPQIARELNVDAILEGSVERFDSRVKVQAKLIQAKTDMPFWSKTYERSTSDILTLQEDVARAIAGEIQIKLTSEELRRLNKPHEVNPEAHDSYLRGRYYWNQRTTASLQQAVAYLEKAISHDPNYALAYATLSDCYQLLPDLNGATARISYPKARTAALRAVELDPSLAEAHAAMAKLKEDYDWDWDGAEQDYKQAIELNPGLGVIHAWYANLLAETGRMPEALDESRRALDLDPLSSFVNSNMASMFYFAGDYDAALKQTSKTLDLDPGNARAYRNLGRIHLAQGSYDKAVAEFQKAVELSPGTSEYVGELGYAFARWGKTDQAQEILSQLQDAFERGESSSYQLALVRSGMGNRELALRLLERALDEKASGIVQLQVTHWFDDLRSEPRFQEILRRAGFVKPASRIA